MTRKDYERAAEILRFEGSAGHAAKVDLFVEFFKGENPRFSEDRFRAACRPQGIRHACESCDKKAA